MTHSHSHTHRHTPHSHRNLLRCTPLLRSAAVLLLCATACSQPARSTRPAASTTPSAASHSGAENTEGGTGTRSKSEEGQNAGAITQGEPPRPEATAESKDDGRALRAAPTTPGVLADSPQEAERDQALSGLTLGSNLGQSSGQGRLAGGAATAAPKMKSGGAYALQAPAAQMALLPPQEFNTENYKHITENRFVTAKEQPLSTFSIDVDTASYSNSRRFLSQGSLPPKDAIRVEEWLNYFSYDYDPPTDGRPFSVHSEVSSCPWNAQHQLVRIGIKGKTISEENVPPRNLVFLLDVSGSMMSPDKLPLVKHGLSMLVNNLREKDSVAMVVYAGASGLVLPPTSGRERGRILSALQQLEAGGSTNGGEGIRLAYSVAQKSFRNDGINRVILATDGDFNVGTSSEGELERLIEEKRKGGVFLTVLGFGTGNVKDSTMEMLADKGNGNYAYIDTATEAQKVLVREAGSTLVTIAKDVKLQAEFNPARVQSYKLIGYENRTLAKEDFNDDKKDAGEIGSGHSVTALYEIVPVGVPSPAVPRVDALKYQAPGALSTAATHNELLTVAVRYKLPQSESSTKFSVVVNGTPVNLANTSADYRFGAAVAQVAMLLRGSPDVQHTNLKAARELAGSSLGLDPHGDRGEFLNLVDRAIALHQGG